MGQNKKYMKQLSTSDKLILLAYGELDRQSTLSLLELIQTDQQLATEWDSVRTMVGELDNMVLTPSDTSFKIVLEHSYKTEHLQEI